MLALFFSKLEVSYMDQSQFNCATNLCRNRLFPVLNKMWGSYVISSKICSCLCRCQCIDIPYIIPSRQGDYADDE